LVYSLNGAAFTYIVAMPIFLENLNYENTILIIVEMELYF